jgi:hypothetical protein
MKPEQVESPKPWQAEEEAKLDEFRACIFTDIYSSFNDAVSISDYFASIGRMISDKRIDDGEEGMAVT